MGMKKWIPRLLVAPAAVLTLLAPVSAGADPWTPPYVDLGNSGVDVFDSSFVFPSSLIAVSAQNNQVLCAGFSSSGDCDFGASGVGLSGTILLPVCGTASQTNCVATMALGTSSTNLVASSFLNMTAGPTIDADPVRGLPEGSTIGLWSNPLENGGGTDTYATSVALSIGFDSFTETYDIESVSASIIPYSVESGGFTVPTLSTSLGQVSVTSDTGSTDPSQNVWPGSCAWTSDGYCGLREDFAPGTVAQLSLRLSNTVGGWFYGRLQDPSLSVSKFDDSSNLVTVTGQSVEVPELQVATPVKDPDPGFVKLWTSQYGSYLGPLGNGGVVLDAGTDTDLSFDAVNDLRNLANNEMSGEASEWRLNTTLAPGNGCLSNTSQILGLVATNAMVYQGSAPTFLNGFLSYDVAGMHFMPDDVTPFLGTYDMVMADSVAQCLYGFSSAPISAEISVTEDSSGDQNVATTSVSDKGGWLHLSAYGFEFSNPVIRAKLTQVSGKSKKNGSSIKTTISCVNSEKRVIKVSEVEPTCPHGFKKL